MNADDELDNLLRNHLSAELDPMRGQAARLFEREVTRPMQRRLRLNAWQGTVYAAGRQIKRFVPMASAMAAAAALGFFVPRWWNGIDASKSEVAEVLKIPPAKLADFEQSSMATHEDHGPFEFPDGKIGRRVHQAQVESARYVDPRTNARTEYYFFPAEQDTVYPAGHQ